MRRTVFVFLVISGLATAAFAHESRPAYLEIQEKGSGRWELLWKTPVLSGMRLPIGLKTPDGVRVVGEPVVQELSDSLLERRTLDAGPGGLAGKRIEFPGLQVTITDVLARISLLDGRTWTAFARPSQPWVEIEPARGAVATALSFLAEGIQHILLGFDHLLFVFGLFFIVRTPWMLVKTITAFTIAHSITLALATLGYASVPLPPLEATIALSILFLGPEIVRVWRRQTSFTIRHPWIVAFAFGLLHGFGFASALGVVGLPQTDIPLALLAFNIGVEIGQLSFVALMIFAFRAFKALRLRWPVAIELGPAYVVGTLGAFWTIQRFMTMLE